MTKSVADLLVIPTHTRWCIVATAVLLWQLLGLNPMHGNAEGAGSLKARAKKLYYGLGVKQNYTQALGLYEKAAAMGDPDAKYIAGGMYFKGLGTEQNFTKAFQLLHQAASSGRSTPESQQVLAQSYLLGQGTHRNYKKAIEWYNEAAENDNSEAQNELGYMYFLGRGVEQDMLKGGGLFLRAARNGLPISQYNVGIMYYTGIGVEDQDLVQAYAWMNIAAANGHRAAVSMRNFLETVLSVDELNQAQEYTETLLERMQ